MPPVQRTYAQEVLADAPVAYWRLGEAVGPNAVDSSGNGHAAIVHQNTPTLDVRGPLMTADDDGAVTYVAASSQWSKMAADDSLLDPRTGSMSYELWLRTSMTTLGGLIRKSDTSSLNGPSLSVLATTGRVQLTMGGAAVTVTVNSSPTGVNYADGNWHHVVAVLDRSANLLRLYVDGVQVNTASAATIAADDINATSVFQLASTGLGVYASGIDGSLDEVAVYATALPVDRVFAHYRAAFRTVWLPASPTRQQLSAVLVNVGVAGNPRRARYGSYGAATAVPGAPVMGVEVVTEAQAALAEQRGRRVVSLTRFAAGIAMPASYRRIAEAAAE